MTLSSAKVLSYIRTKPSIYIFNTIHVQCPPRHKKHVRLIFFRFNDDNKRLWLTNPHKTQLVNILYV